MDFETIIYEKKDRKAVITLNRPDRLNALNGKMSEELFQVWSDVRDDPDVWVAIMTGTGDRAFSAGADLKEAVENREEGAPSFRMPTIPVGGNTKNMHIWKPMIAAINGYALGGGLEMALACAIRIAAEHARLGLPEVRWSLMAAAGGVTRLPRAIPRAVAMKMVLTGEPLTAQQALQWGLVTDVVPLADLMTTAHAIADRILENAPLAVQAAKEMVTRGLDLSLDGSLATETDYIMPLRHTDDFKEGPRAFAEKRKPIFKGR
ncbi:MAG: enoyl-CoA hydratase/isomerase family protein [Chloroflexi bacterium]|nr:enoyl-CoA hydratase/isomerase family protein [Chloroflexota bacterium]